MLPRRFVTLNTPLKVVRHAPSTAGAASLPTSAATPQACLDRKLATPKQDQIVNAGKLIAGARRVCVFAGAGLSAESGIPTYRDALGNSSGLWNGLTGSLGLLFFGTKLGYLFAPELSWRIFSSKLLEPIQKATQNAGHDALVDLERLLGSLPIITQNIDGLSQKAGSSRCLEIHGTAHSTRHAWTGSPNPSSFKRPNVVLFGESLPPAFYEALDIIDTLDERDVLLVVGTSCTVAPAAMIPYKAMLAGARVVELNLRRELASQYQHSIPGIDEFSVPLPVGKPVDLEHLQTFIEGPITTTLPLLYAATVRTRRQAQANILFGSSAKKSSRKSLIWGKTSCW